MEAAGGDKALKPKKIVYGVRILKGGGRLLHVVDWELPPIGHGGRRGGARLFEQPNVFHGLRVPIGHCRLGMAWRYAWGEEGGGQGFVSSQT